MLAVTPVVPPETGGVLGCDAKGTVCTFVFDSGMGEPDEVSYIPDVDKINRCIRSWHNQGIVFGGIIHSHPSGAELLSCEDKIYIRSIFDAMPSSVTQLYFPVLIPQKKIIPFAAIRGDNGVIIQHNQIVVLEGGE